MADPNQILSNLRAAPRKGQVIRIRNRETRKGKRIEYMRLLMDASESTANMDLGLVLYGYRTRADGSPTHVRPVARCLAADQVEIVVTPGEEARSALHCGASRDGLSPAARAEYDRLLAQIMRANPEIGSGATETIPLIGRCVNCKRPFRVEIPAGHAGWAGAAQAIRAAGLEVPSCDCRARGIRCPEDANGLPACGDDFCDGHGPSEVKFTRLQVTYKPGAVCGPGNCWGAVASKCTCSCRGKNHGQMWAVTRSARW